MRFFLLFFGVLIWHNLSSQSLLSDLLVSPNVQSENLRLLDGDSEKILLAVSPLAENIGVNAVDLNSSDSDALLFCDSNLYPEWSLGMTNGNVVAARLTTDGHILVAVVPVNPSLSIVLSEGVVLEGVIHVLKLSVLGEILWFRALDGAFRQSCISLEVSPIDQSIYFVSCIVNTNGENPIIEFAGEDFISIGENFDFPDNSIILKFSSSGEELWGRTISGFYTGIDETAISESGMLTIAGRADGNGANIVFADSQMQFAGSYIGTYDSSGDEIWSKFFFSQKGQILINSQVQEIEYIGDQLYALASVSSSIDSLIFGDEIVNFNCGFGDSNQWLMTFDNTGQEMDALTFGCSSFSSNSAHNQMRHNDNGLSIIFSFRDEMMLSGQVYQATSDYSDVAFVGVSEDLLINFVRTISSTSNSSFLPEDYSLITTEDRCFVGLVFDDGISTGDYSFANGEDDNTIILEFATSTGVPEISNEELMIYPNPAHDKLQLSLPTNSLNSGYSVLILDAAGRKVLQTRNTNDIDVSDLSTGYYVLTLVSKETVVTERFIKE